MLQEVLDFSRGEGGRVERQPLTFEDLIAILALILGDRHLGPFLLIGRAALWVVVVTALVSAAGVSTASGDGMLVTVDGDRGTVEIIRT